MTTHYFGNFGVLSMLYVIRKENGTFVSDRTADGFCFSTLAAQKFASEELARERAMYLRLTGFNIEVYEEPPAR